MTPRPVARLPRSRTRLLARTLLLLLSVALVLAPGAAAAPEDGPRELPVGEEEVQFRIGESLVYGFELTDGQVARAQVGLAVAEGEPADALDGATLRIRFAAASEPDRDCSFNEDVASKPEGQRQGLGSSRAIEGNPDPCRRPGSHLFVAEVIGGVDGALLDAVVIASIVSTAPPPSATPTPATTEPPPPAATPDEAGTASPSDGATVAAEPAPGTEEVDGRTGRASVLSLLLPLGTLLVVGLVVRRGRGEGRAGSED